MGGKPRAKKKQAELPGFEREVINAIEEPLADMFEDRAKRKAALAGERTAKEQVIAAMVDAKLDAYRYVDGDLAYTVRLDSTHKLKFKQDKLPGDEADDDSGDSVAPVIDLVDAIAERTATVVAEVATGADGWHGEGE